MHPSFQYEIHHFSVPLTGEACGHQDRCGVGERTEHAERRALGEREEREQDHVARVAEHTSNVFRDKHSRKSSCGES